MHHIYYAVGSLVILVLDVITISSITDSDLGTTGKIIWTIFTFIFPIIATIAWFLTKPKEPEKYYSDPHDLL